MDNDSSSVLKDDVDAGSVERHGSLGRRPHRQLKESATQTSPFASREATERPTSRARVVPKYIAQSHPGPVTFHHLPQLYISLTAPKISDVTSTDLDVTEASVRKRHWKHQATLFRYRMRHYKHNFPRDIVVPEVSDPALQVAGHRVRSLQDTLDSAVDFDSRPITPPHATSASLFLHETTVLGRRRVAECRSLLRGNFVLLSSQAQLHCRSASTSPSK